MRALSEIQDPQAVATGASEHAPLDRKAHPPGLGELLEGTLDAALEITGASFGIIQLFEPKSARLGLAAQRGFEPGTAAVVAAAEAGLFSQRERVVVENPGGGVGDSPAQTELLEAGVAALQITPLISHVGARLLGLFSTYYRQPWQSSRRETRILDLLACQARDLIEKTAAEQALRESDQRYITQRMRAEDALRESENKFHSLAGNAPAAIFIKDLEGRYTLVNPLASRALGRPDGAQGLTDHQMLPADQAEALRRVDLEVIASGQARSSEEIVAEQTWLSVKFPLLDTKGKPAGVCGVAIDITERKQAQEALRESEQRLEKAIVERTAELRQTNEQLEEFVYSIAHDLRAPVRAMEACSRLLEGECAAQLGATGHELTQRINRSAVFMDRMLLDLLEYGRTARETLHLGPVDVQSAWQMALFQCQDSIRETGARVEVLSTLPSVRGHEQTLAQALTNLLSNALRFVNPNTQPHVRLYAEVRGTTARLWIEDNGVGIAPEHQERIFRVFERLHGESYPGTGIGLAIVRRGVERMGGTVGLESALGQGARFWIELPAIEPPAAARERA